MYPKHVAQLVNTDAAVVILVEQFKQLPIGLHLRTNIGQNQTESSTLNNAVQPLVRSQNKTSYVLCDCKLDEFHCFALPLITKTS